MDQEIHPTNNAAKFAFFYVLSLVALVFMSFGVGTILFQFINKFILDIINENSGIYQADSLKFAISALLIASPIFYITMREIHKNLFSGTMEKNSEVRKWLTYFILLVTSVIMIGWFISVFNNFLGGELTMKIGLKAVVAIAINAIIFSYYFYDIKREEIKGQKNKIIKIYFYASLVLVVAVFVSALFIVESPTQTRNRKIDERVLNNMGMIQSAVEGYYQEFKVMPKDFTELKSKELFLTDDILKNTATNKQIEYKVTGDKEYELCTDFLASNREQTNNAGNYIMTTNGIPGDNLHDAGHQCLKKRVVIIDPVKTMEAKPVVN